MRRRLRRLRGIAAWLVVLVLLAPGGLSAGSGCGVCPSDCPMHRAVTADVPDMPCHRAEPSRAGEGPRLAASCGHRESFDLGVQLRERCAAVRILANERAAGPRVPARTVAPTSPDPDVPTRPPRDDRSA